MTDVPMTVKSKDGRRHTNSTAEGEAPLTQSGEPRRAHLPGGSSWRSGASGWLPREARGHLPAQLCKYCAFRTSNPQPRSPNNPSRLAYGPLRLDFCSSNANGLCGAWQRARGSKKGPCSSPIHGIPRRRYSPRLGTAATYGSAYPKGENPGPKAACTVMGRERRGGRREGAGGKETDTLEPCCKRTCWNTNRDQRRKPG